MESFFQANYAIVVSASGQAFFVIGLLAAWEWRRRRGLPLGRPLWMLAGFGLLYALAEWGRVFIPIQSEYLPWSVTVLLWLLRLLVLAAAFAGLLQFGIELLPPRSRGHLRAAPPVLFSVMVALTLGGGALLSDRLQVLFVAEAAARVLLALPGAAACALGLAVQAHFSGPRGGPALGRMLSLTAAAAALLGLALGLLVPPFGPWSGTAWLFGIPAEFWRALSGLLFAIGLARALVLLQADLDHEAAETARRLVEGRIRERLGRELADSVAQHLYAVGLMLGEAAQRQPAEAPVRRALAELDTSLDELRGFLTASEVAAREAA